jgi:hypothetical protein
MFRNSAVAEVNKIAGVVSLFLSECVNGTPMGNLGV